MATLKELRVQLQEPRYRKMKKLHVFTKYIYSQLATPIIKVLLKTSVTGNQVTVFWVCLGIFSCLLLTLGQYWVTLTAVILLQLHLVLDYVDGPIARARNQISLKGVYIERVGHDVIFTLFFFCIAVGSLKRGLSPVPTLIIGFSAAFGYFFYKYTRRAMIYCSLVYRDRSQETSTQRLSSSACERAVMPEVSMFRKIYRKSQQFWDPVVFTTLALPLAILDLLYLIPFFYGLTYPFQFLLSYVYQSKIMDRWVDDWVRVIRS